MSDASIRRAAARGGALAHREHGAAPQVAAVSADARGPSLARGLRDAAIGAAGIAGAIALWWAATHWLAGPQSPARLFAPERALDSVPALLRDERLGMHVRVSVMRVATGLGIALALGVPLGLLIGRVKWLDALLSPTFQLLRMISPLSWMPVAVMSFGIGERSICFLLAFAALWPILMSTASGVAQIDRRWLELGESLAATRAELAWHVVLPAITASVLGGMRLAIGVLWIVLVPAEMLGVSAGLGYLVLDTRDRLAYPELAAVIVVIGAIGLALDAFARAALARWTSASG
ncbi:binding--dependent transport system inner membrane component family protein [Burkholderia thailandensis MSMB121]|uniref:ABC transporter permease n=1 Tax=Burkholderia humptydooensis TaxID=430531 RepID=UPI0003280AE5|nr:ABC transporter permease [Burkholderia humptydooensis]AGK50622.1 binding--dependent transport system inner membrane component family protein [Burkholderia thailandensis MSMB121]ATF32161.1 ABC transporter permease [Burkholderia thailandensis]KST72232.1 ABC transporter permease [Burkholderia humptydooensis]